MCNIAERRTFIDGVRGGPTQTVTPMQRMFKNKHINSGYISF